MDRWDLKEGDHLDIVLDEGSFIENAIVLHYKKPVVPQCVADWIDVCKENLAIGLHTALNPDFVKQYNKSNELITWVRKHKNQEVFARAWIFGYEVYKDKKYLVKIKGISDDQCYLNCVNSNDNTKEWILYDESEYTHIINKHTRKELEEAGFGWVFDCPGIEIEEVEE